MNLKNEGVGAGAGGWGGGVGGEGGWGGGALIKFPGGYSIVWMPDFGTVLFHHFPIIFWTSFVSILYRFGEPFWHTFSIILTYFRSLFST